MAMGAALLIGLLMSAGLMGGSELLKVYTGKKMAGIQEGAMKKKHQMDLDTMALLSGKQLAREQELLGRQEALSGSQKQTSLEQMMLSALSQQAMGAQAGYSGVAQQAVASLGAPEPPVEGMGMVDMLRMS